MEENIVDQMSSSLGETRDVQQPIDSLTYNTFVGKFNDEYSSLNEDQKQLLGNYISSFADNGLDLKVYLNEEIGRIKKELLAQKGENKNIEFSDKIQEIYDIVSDIKNSPIDPESLEIILNAQEVLKEFKKNED